MQKWEVIASFLPGLALSLASAFKAPDNKVTFLKSLFTNRAPTAFFQYPEWIDSKKYSVRANQYGGEALEHLFMSFSMDSEYNTATSEIC